MAGRVEYLGEPTLARVMRRPRWIAALFAVFALAAVFAGLAQWQLENAVRLDVEKLADTETPRLLSAVARPGAGLTEEAAGAVVTAKGVFSVKDLTLVHGRNQDGRVGVWVVGNFIAEERARIVVAIAWAEGERQADAGLKVFRENPCFALYREIVGRASLPESPVVPKPAQSPDKVFSMAPGQLVNLWGDGEGLQVYGGYTVLHDTRLLAGSGCSAMEANLLARTSAVFASGADAAGDSENTDAENAGDPENARDAGDTENIGGTGGTGDAGGVRLEKIVSPAPDPPEKVNMLNLFYGIEWVVFAGFALFFWFRLTRDAWQKEHEMIALQKRAAGSGASTVSPVDGS